MKTDMSYNIIYRCMLSAFVGAACCVSCSEEDLVRTSEAGNISADGMVIVDYTVNEASTRSISHTPLPAHERIKSLVYLLYDADGRLVKQREIPDMDKMAEGDWPMKRATMTWAQREALKDTLKQGLDYTAVFVANANPALFGGEEVLHLTKTMGGEEIPASLEEIYLSLPRTTAFNDHNMFYLCVRQINSTADGNNRDLPLNCPVQLQRVVSRTDFFSDDYPAWDSDFTRGKIREFTDKVYGQLIPVSSTDELKVKAMLQTFTTEFYEFTYQYTLIPMEGPIYAAWVADLANNVNNSNCTQFVNNMSSTDESAVKDLLYASCLNNQKLQSLWQPWTGLQAKVAYDGCADRFYVSSHMSGNNVADEMKQTPFLDMVQIPGKEDEPLQNTFTLIGFGENPDAVTEGGKNRMREVQLYQSTDAASPLSVLPLPADMQSFAEQGGNERVQLKYRPIKTLVYNKSFTTGPTYCLSPVNLKSILPSSLFISDVYKRRLQEFFDDEKGRKYGTSIENFILEITLPDLSRPEALTVEPEWTLR